ncbi:MAG TPA: uracil-DNA glycosylase family protein [Bacilli bacterium]|nr:uracil-DNA glycosylase family protein [Bacilli bacterium]
MFKKEIMNDPENLRYTKNNIAPIYKVSREAVILLIGQAPGAKAEAKQEVFRDQSGKRLRDWLGLDEETFYSNKIAVLPMDFYFPGKGKTGDLPPRKGFADKWHPQLIKMMPNIKITILMGKYAVKHYLNENSVTSAVQNYRNYLPLYFPLIHPSPLNQRWISKNLWFNDVLTHLKEIIKFLLK